MTAKKILLIASTFLVLAVAIGAFGAHGLEKTLSEKALNTFETGVRYHFYHALGLLILGCMQHLFQQIQLKMPVLLLSAGILLFSFNCYLYAVTGIKAMAMIVPIGGVCFIAGWATLMLKVKGSKI